MKLFVAALDFVAEELEAVPDMYDPRLPRPDVSGFGGPHPLRL